VLIAQTAPAVRVAIAETLGLPPGAVKPGQLVEGLRRLGFDYVFGAARRGEGRGDAGPRARRPGPGARAALPPRPRRRLPLARVHRPGARELGQKAGAPERRRPHALAPAAALFSDPTLSARRNAPAPPHKTAGSPTPRTAKHTPKPTPKLAPNQTPPSPCRRRHAVWRRPDHRGGGHGAAAPPRGKGRARRQRRRGRRRLAVGDAGRGRAGPRAGRAGVGRGRAGGGAVCGAAYVHVVLPRLGVDGREERARAHPLPVDVRRGAPPLGSACCLRPPAHDWGGGVAGGVGFCWGLRVGEHGRGFASR
jgi:hypothetical protein